MKVGVMSDTHGSPFAIMAAIRAIPDADAWIHLGDYADDAEKLRRECGNKEVYTVNGNSLARKDIPYERVVVFENVRVFVTHGHRYDVEYDRTKLIYRAMEENCSVALYGHTHVPNVEAHGKLLIANPGSPALPRACSPKTVAVLNIDNTDYDIRIVRI